MALLRADPESADRHELFVARVERLPGPRTGSHQRFVVKSSGATGSAIRVRNQFSSFRASWRSVHPFCRQGKRGTVRATVSPISRGPVHLADFTQRKPMCDVPESGETPWRPLAR